MTMMYLPSEIGADCALILKKNPMYETIDKQSSPLCLSYCSQGPRQADTTTPIKQRRIVSFWGKGAIRLKSSNKGMDPENNLSVPTLHPARIPLDTPCLGVDSLSIAVGSTQSKVPV